MKSAKRPPMGYSIEILSAIVRVGPNHHVLGQPFDFAVVVSSVDGKVGVMKALNKERPGEGGDPMEFTKPHGKAVLRGVREGLKLKPDFVRFIPGRPVRHYKRTVPKKTR